MNRERLTNWIDEVSERLPAFVRRLEMPECAGRYGYTVSEPLSKTVVWGLGQTCFAVRILFQSGQMTDSERTACTAFIRRFERSNGAINDAYIAHRSRWRRLLSGLRHLDPDILTNQTNTRAETRQSTAALFNLGQRPTHDVTFIPTTVDGITGYVDRLNWHTPWAASSHVNHLLFFIKFNRALGEDVKASLINHVLILLKQRQRSDGSFGGGASGLPAHQRVGSAMKILMGAALVNREAELVSTKLIDAALDDPACRDACEHFNTLFVLYQCSKQTSHRRDEIAEMALRVADEWLQFYWPQCGAFSFNKGRSASEYYGARIGQGLPEPDIHGSAMFYWGLLLISKLLELKLSRPMHEPIL
jgi:hypothetical protein